MHTDGLIPMILLGVLGVSLIGLAYLATLGARALFREARQTARQAGHRPRSASVRAVVRMVLWSVYFAAFYFSVSLLGKRLGWWAAIPAFFGVAVLVVALLRIDELLTVRPGDLRRHIGIGAILAAVGAVFGSVIWLGVQL